MRAEVSEPYLSDPDFTLWHGDARDVLAELEPESVDCCATSPPFYGLRDYGTGTWEGGDEDCDHLTSSVSRGQRADRTFTQDPANIDRENCRKCGARRVDRQIGLEATPEQWCEQLVRVFAGVKRVLKPTGTLWIECGDSYAAGGTGRNDGDRMGSGGFGGPPALSQWRGTKATARRACDHKPKDLLGQPWLLAFALRQDGWYLRQAIIWAKPNAMPESVRDRCTNAHSYVFLLSKQPRYWFDADAIAEPQVEPWRSTGRVESLGSGTAMDAGVNGGFGLQGRRPRLYNPNGKNARSVWTIPTSGYPDAHFATWPEALVERIVKAGCPEGGVILDPFMGSGTTALVARRLGRKAIGIELNERYCALARRRTQQLSLLAR